MELSLFEIWMGCALNVIPMSFISLNRIWQPGFCGLAHLSLDFRGAVFLQPERPMSKILFVVIQTSKVRKIQQQGAFFMPLPREELVTKFKSRLKDRPFTVASTGEGFPEFLGKPRLSFPHGVRVINLHQSSLAELTTKCMEYVEEKHTQHPAILFRGLPAETALDLSTIAKEIPWKGMTYEGGTAFRLQIDKSVGAYTANDDPDDVTIDPHNEMSYTEAYPSKVNSLLKYRTHDLRMQ